MCRPPHDRLGALCRERAERDLTLRRSSIEKVAGMVSVKKSWKKTKLTRERVVKMSSRSKSGSTRPGLREMKLIMHLASHLLSSSCGRARPSSSCSLQRARS